MLLVRLPPHRRTARLACIETPQLWLHSHVNLKPGWLWQEAGRPSPQLQLLAQGEGQAEPQLSPNLFKRVLELLAYLVRSNERLATAMVSLRIPGPPQPALVEVHDTKGKQRAGALLRYLR